MVPTAAYVTLAAAAHILSQLASKAFRKAEPPGWICASASSSMKNDASIALSYPQNRTAFRVRLWFGKSILILTSGRAAGPSIRRHRTTTARQQ